jgi:hypothetical protein
MSSQEALGHISDWLSARRVGAFEIRDGKAS